MPKPSGSGTRWTEPNRQRNGARNGNELRSDRFNEFVLAQVSDRCWLVAYNGRLIAGALLSSLRAAIDYAAAVAEGSGRPRFHLRVIPAGH